MAEKNAKIKQAEERVNLNEKRLEELQKTLKYELKERKKQIDKLWITLREKDAKIKKAEENLKATEEVNDVLKAIRGRLTNILENAKERIRELEKDKKVFPTHHTKSPLTYPPSHNTQLTIENTINKTMRVVFYRILECGMKSELR
ncbi:hypothetical protein M951_chr3196 (nucleomorph) [Lotharella oceanica]|uniref:Uncharacterized protein n=1 Tax=Lotharella oceanica TaxID=641309 RepID=A0A060D6U9_9EUKA|nr:hypothetical protein M951_chr19 [Lotharella oceanica]AIB09701.1 hypothetical protein M951_chr1222 [Lotharella oceanica]AIB09712.1 hypothetical protein M951_chr29 [Lotharella oceanica]AIB09904.1 hypothetical protein M951_chr2212 [Lotharella oceanica]AIB09915.1 hypothetical protein M951_chr39 [Lotharella oceanica]